MKGRLFEAAKHTSRLEREFGAVKTAICPPESWQHLTTKQLAGLFPSQPAERRTQLAEMQERPPVAKYSCEIFSKEHHEDLRSEWMKVMMSDGLRIIRALCVPGTVLSI